MNLDDWKATINVIAVYEFPLATCVELSIDDGEIQFIWCDKER